MHKKFVGDTGSLDCKRGGGGGGAWSIRFWVCDAIRETERQVCLGWRVTQLGGDLSTPM